MANCCDCTAQIEYTRSGTQQDFTFPFEYYEESEVKVSLYNKSNQQWEATTNFTFVNPTTIRLGFALNGRMVIYRCTDISQARATFVPGTPIKAQELNDNYDQLRNAIDEAKCCGDDALDRLDAGYRFWLNRVPAGTTHPTFGVRGDLVQYNSDLKIDDDHVASTKWIDERYWDRCNKTTYRSDSWSTQIDDGHVPTTGAVEKRLKDLNLTGGTLNPGVTRILAGTNVTISPVTGKGEVTINATASSSGGGDADNGLDQVVTSAPIGAVLSNKVLTLSFNMSSLPTR